MNDCDSRTEFRIVATIIALAVIICPAVWIVSSSFEAGAFNRLTGGHATTWDAMWTELRVMGEEPR